MKIKCEIEIESPEILRNQETMTEKPTKTTATNKHTPRTKIEKMCRECVLNNEIQIKRTQKNGNNPNNYLVNDYFFSLLSSIY